MTVEFVRMTAVWDPYYPSAMELYAQSFPLHEQRQAFSQAAIMADSAYHFYRIMDGDVFVGILLNWQTDDFIYVEHFCILPKLRGNGYGRQALKLIAGFGKNVILEIDPPVDDVSVRRKHFYESAGYVENEFSHVHPPYHAGHAGHDLVVMSCPHALDAAQYRVFNLFLCSAVMANACIPPKRGFFIKTGRIGFSKWKAEDYHLAELLWGNPEVTKLICAGGCFSKEDIVNRLKQEIRNDAEHGVQYWPIFALATGELIGCCGLRPHGEREYEIGFHLRPEFWRQGYAEEAARAAIDYAFSALKAGKLFAGHNPNNVASRKVLNKLGFSYIGDVFYEPTGLYHPSYELKQET